MATGLCAELNELIDLKRHAKKVHYKPDRKSLKTGAQLTKIRGRGMDFDEVRHYQAGDEVRHMEWRVTAKTGKPHVKLYQEERERPVVILTDFNPSMYFGTRIAFKSVVAARLSALLAWTAIKQGDCVGGFLFSGQTHHEFMPKGREAAVLPLLAAYAEYTQQHGQQETASRCLSYALRRVRRVVRPGSILIIISDFHQQDRDLNRYLLQLRCHNDVLIYHVCDPIELTAPTPQQYPITDGPQEMLFDTTQKAVRQAYQTYCDERIATLELECRKLKIQYTQVTSSSDVPLLVRQTFPWRKHA